LSVSVSVSAYMYAYMCNFLCVCVCVFYTNTDTDSILKCHTLTLFVLFICDTPNTFITAKTQKYTRDVSMYILVCIYTYVHMYIHIIYTYHIGRTVLDTGLSCFSVHHHVDDTHICMYTFYIAHIHIYIRIYM